MFELGNCITDVSLGDVCELNSTALECVNDTLIVSSCLCDIGYMGTRACHLAGAPVIIHSYFILWPMYGNTSTTWMTLVRQLW